ncbi:MAG TPA: phosphotransferase [Candidatus Methanoperedens sp.]|nr:phosphotransferase [Candidatus Methanoperedens sp.]
MPAPEAIAWARRAVPDLDASQAPQSLPPAGSSRVLARLFGAGGSIVLVENPVAATAAVNENDGFVYLAAHLGTRGVPVPAVLAYERERGWLLVEDLGDRDLFAEARRALGGNSSADHAALAALYREALDVLVRLQVDGAAGFDPRRTHNPPCYDVALMREAESGYFLRELVVGHLGLALPAGLEAELDRLAARAAGAGTAFLLHRDYQSQNLKLHRGRVRVIDFQGARLGPPQYDLAALLLDPYADLPRRLREELLAHYLGAFTARTGADRGAFLAHFPAIAAHRLMQALGAYAFLGLRRGKPAFLAHVPTALRLLEETLVPLAAEAAHLTALVAAARRHPRAAAGVGWTSRP